MNYKNKDIERRVRIRQLKRLLREFKGISFEIGMLLGVLFMGVFMFLILWLI